ncbi:MAG TPA: CPBP family intramembrane glutamic endopeptidase [Candidatus Lokiarchaeia archaeon]|nr:CPBP family intramembrane glutamic endopeptidase [Candidatus Lokiarchaeia archaeon]
MEPEKSVINRPRPSGDKLILTDADPRRVRRIELWNLLEPIIVMALVLTGAWTLAVQYDYGSPQVLPLLVGILLWALIFSPLVHYKYEKDLYLRPEDQNIWFYFFECRGMGSARRYFFSVDGQPPLWKQNKKFIAIMLAIWAVWGVLALIGFKDDYANILAKAHLGTDIGTMIGIGALLLAVVIPLLFVALSVLCRFDNLAENKNFVIIMFALIIPLLVVFNLIFQAVPSSTWQSILGNYYKPPDAAERLTSWDFFGIMGQYFGYFFWGWAQQFIFLGYFNTLFTKGIKNKKVRSIINGVFFGLIHIPSWGLVTLTIILGVIFSWQFSEHRNLFAFGLIHGFGGTMASRLLPIGFTVGPRSI